MMKLHVTGLNHRTAPVEVREKLALAPGAAIAITVFSINLLGDGLRDAFDPRLHS